MGLHLVKLKIDVFVKSWKSETQEILLIDFDITYF